MELKQKLQLLWLALLATIIWAVLMGWEANGYRREQCPELPTNRGLSSPHASPIGALEVTTSEDTFEVLINQCSSSNNRLWNIHVAQANTCMDFLFIALYGGVFLLFANVLDGRLSRWVTIAILLTMLMDVGENVCLLVSLHFLAYPPGNLHPPGLFSIPKWILFAFSLVLLGGLFAQARGMKRLWRVVMATVMIIAGISVVGGLFYLPLLTVAFVPLGIGLLVALGLFFPIRPFSISKLLLWIETLYLLRFQMFGGAILALILPISYFAAPSIFIGIFDALGFVSFVFVVWAALELAWTVMITSRMVLVYGPDRYSALRTLQADNIAAAAVDGCMSDHLSWPVVGCFGALALPSILMTISGTSDIHWWQKILGSLIAVVFSLVGLWLTARLHVWIEPDPGHSAKQLYPQFGLLKARNDVSRSAVGRVLDKTLARILPDDLKDGILSTNGRLRSGHQLAMTAVAVLLVIYLVAGIAFSPSSGLNPPAAVFFLLFLLTLLTWAFSGIAFFLDVLRVPVLTSILVLSLLTGFVATDHTFKGDSISPVDIPPSPKEIVQKWKLNQVKNSDAPIVIVATAGGGIRASAWTAEVLTRIAEDCQQSDGKNPFASSLLLVSSVSGGSQGTMYVLGSYSASNGKLNMETLPDVRDASSRTALSAVGWGILYPDLLRTVPVVGSATGAFLGHDIDRGWALENEWVKNWKRPLWSSAPKIDDWVKDTRNGKRPAVIFNATVSETGQRFIIGSSSLPSGKNVEWGSTALQFSNAYPHLNIPISTAARLSASFPWVSPMPRTEEGFLHFADGGYYDNSGVLSASEWLLAAKDEIQNRQVILILIDASSTDPSKPMPWSWQRQFVAPIGTLLSVRTNSQQSRAAFELHLMSDDLRQHEIRVTDDSFSYHPDRMAPLSWHLTPEQQRSIGEAWSNASPELAATRFDLYRALGCSASGKK
ncbi:hypothetical protein P8935_05155 [Telmatobacter sp. DSM 110680]|uniref:PNPLA domain-containing protein n=1 Tax=Telmatobacter sp. DSM 110680 TaxID=3036704 RepID=A0AAU7DM21_9BACT